MINCNSIKGSVKNTIDSIKVTKTDLGEDAKLLELFRDDPTTSIMFEPITDCAYTHFVRIESDGLLPLTFKALVE